MVVAKKEVFVVLSNNSVVTAAKPCTSVKSFRLSLCCNNLGGFSDILEQFDE